LRASAHGETFGRDYADISFVAGLILGSREQDVDVKVDVVPRA
jgi:hypothetical protein